MMPKFGVKDIELLDIDTLVLAKKNPRFHSESNIAKIAQSIRTYGWTSPALITDKLEVIAGHGRIYAARKLGMTEVPCVRLSHLTPKLVEAYRIADNRLGLDSEWDEDVLGELLKGMHADADFATLFTGFDEMEIASRLGLDTDPSAEWGGMPEFNEQDKRAYRSIMVHFSDQAGVDKFAELLEATISESTKFIWYPKIPNAKFVDKRYRAEK